LLKNVYHSDHQLTNNATKRTTQHCIDSQHAMTKHKRKRQRSTDASEMSASRTHA